MSTSLEDELREYAVTLDKAIEQRAVEHIWATVSPTPRPLRVSHRWLRRGLAMSLALGGLAAIAVIIGTHEAGGDPRTVVNAPGTDPTTAQSSETGLASDPTGPASSAAVISGPLDRNSTGGDVSRLQTRLVELHFVPGSIDGVFGPETEQAVWAYKKLVVGVSAPNLAHAVSPSLVTPELWQQMQQPVDIRPRRTLGAGTTHVEIYLPDQVMAVFTNDQPTLIAHISSGTGSPWCETVNFDIDANGNRLDPPLTKAVCGVATTPGGVFTITKRAYGDVNSSLGPMNNPVFFNYGIAVHGASTVPLQPVTHGTVRINNAVASLFPSLVADGDPVYVWGVDGRQPEQYTKQEMVPTFNYPDPSATQDTRTTQP